MPDVKKFTYAQVKEHNKATDLWMVIDDKVYDVTKFLNEVGFYMVLVITKHTFNKYFLILRITNQHPGGEEVLIDAAGKDGNERILTLHDYRLLCINIIDFIDSFF